MNLYLVTNKIDSYYVVAEDATTAQYNIETELNKSDYGAISHRKVTDIKILGTEIFEDRKNPFRFSSGANLLLPRKPQQEKVNNEI